MFTPRRSGRDTASLILSQRYIRLSTRAKLHMTALIPMRRPTLMTVIMSRRTTTAIEHANHLRPIKIDLATP